MAIDGFATPWWLLLLVPVAALVVGYLLAQRRRQRAVMRFTNLELLEKVAPKAPNWRRHVPAALLGVALLLLTIGLAGPTAETKVPRNRATVFLVIDVSLSMNATDVAPSRIIAAKEAASQFVRNIPPTINLGLESFAGTPAILVPATTNRDEVVRQINTLQLAESTATGEAIVTALNGIEAFNAAIPGSEGGPPPARIVLMSDGKQTVGRDEYAAAALAAQKHIPISTISFGTDYGSIVLPETHQRVAVPVDDAALDEVARISGGNFYPAQSNLQLHQVYDTLREQIGYQTVRADASKPWLVLGTLLCLLGAGLALVRGQRLPA
ncbi:MAG TPA: VWA domain-containing protein [Pseudonocardia sp.]|jgi:Ca-activated chloride channel family protein